MKTSSRERRRHSPRAAAQKSTGKSRLDTALRDSQAEAGSTQDERLTEAQRLATVAAALSFSRWRRLP
jgi:hypothetical protein